MHEVNIIVHVTFGIIAILVGLWSIFSRKGGRQHILSGRIFLSALSVVILTASIGVLFYRDRPFLMVITLLSFYQGFSGFRLASTKHKKPALPDYLVYVLSLFLGIYLVNYLSKTDEPWNPTIVYSTLGYLGAILLYDLVKFIRPKPFTPYWRYEHLVKILGSYFALVSAFTGTVLDNWQPYSQILPSGLGMMVILIFCIKGGLKDDTILA